MADIIGRSSCAVCFITHPMLHDLDNIQGQAISSKSYLCYPWPFTKGKHLINYQHYFNTPINILESLPNTGMLTTDQKFNTMSHINMTVA